METILPSIYCLHAYNCVDDIAILLCDEENDFNFVFCVKTVIPQPMFAVRSPGMLVVKVLPHVINRIKPYIDNGIVKHVTPSVDFVTNMVIYSLKYHAMASLKTYGDKKIKMLSSYINKKFAGYGIGASSDLMMDMNPCNCLLNDELLDDMFNDAISFAYKHEGFVDIPNFVPIDPSTINFATTMVVPHPSYQPPIGSTDPKLIYKHTTEGYYGYH